MSAFYIANGSAWWHDVFVSNKLLSIYEIYPTDGRTQFKLFTRFEQGSNAIQTAHTFLNKQAY